MSTHTLEKRPSGVAKCCRGATVCLLILFVDEYTSTVPVSNISLYLGSHKSLRY